MSMQAESLEVLEKAELPPAQARAIVRAIEIELTGARDVLATKHDLLLLRQDFAELRADVREQFTGLRSELREQINGLRSELRGEITGLRSELQGEIMGLRSESREGMASLRGELRAEIHASASSVARQMYLAVLGQSAVMLGFAYFVTTQLR